MKWLTLERIKHQCRIEMDFHDEDDDLMDKGEVAEEAVLNYCDRSYEYFIEKFGEIPPPVRQASLLLVDLYYTRRSPADAQNMSAVPYGNIDALLRPYMKLAYDVNENNNRYGCPRL